MVARVRFCQRKISYTEHRQEEEEEKFICRLTLLRVFQQNPSFYQLLSWLSHRNLSF